MSINDEMMRQTNEQNINSLVDRLREERDEALVLLQATQAELFDRTVAHEVSHSMARAYLAMMSDTLIELTQPDVDKDAEPPELPQIAKKVRTELDALKIKWLQTRMSRDGLLAAMRDHVIPFIEHIKFVMPTINEEMDIHPEEAEEEKQYVESVENAVRVAMPEEG